MMTDVVMKEAARLAAVELGSAWGITSLAQTTALHYHRLMTEGWRPEPKLDPAMEKALDVARNAMIVAGHGGVCQYEVEAAASVIADAVAGAVADARVKVPADVMEAARQSFRHNGRSGPTDSQIMATYLIAAEDGQ